MLNVVKKTVIYLSIFLVLFSISPNQRVSADPPPPQGVAWSYKVTDITEFEGNQETGPYLKTNRLSGDFAGKRLFTTSDNTNKINKFRKVKGSEFIVGPSEDGNWKVPKGHTLVEKISYPVYEYRTYPVSEIDCLANGPVVFGITKDKVGTCHPTTFAPDLPENQWAVAIGFESWQYRSIVNWRGSRHYEWATMEFEAVFYEYKIKPDNYIEIRPKTATINVGKTQDYESFLMQHNGEEMNITNISKWSAEQTNIAQPTNGDNNTFKGLSHGSTKIKATWNGYEAEAMLHVQDVSLPDPPEFEPPEPDPIGPVANLFVEPEFFWPETVTFYDYSTDPDGEIMLKELRVDGQTSSFTRNFPRVTQEESHVAELTVTDDDLLSDSDSKTFKILPTTPVAHLQISGTLKENRKVSFDAHSSDNATRAIRVAPINYDLTTWEFKPISEGISQSDIKIATSADGGLRDVLFKKAGEYEVTITVTNKYNETSKPYTLRFQIAPDEKPISQFIVDQQIYLRDGGTGKATIKLTDYSRTVDNDYIKQRIWYVDYDSNNDGLFGTPMDNPREIISSENETTVYFETDRVGHYKFSLETVEGFSPNEPTIERFITEDDYRRDVTEPIDSEGRVSEYQKQVNFNVIDKETSIEVSNSAPTVDLGFQTHRKVDVVLDVGGLTKATQQHQTGNRPGGTSTNDGGGRYDHYYFTFDYGERNELASLAASLESDLRGKGIDAKIIIDQNYYHVYDQDGTCIRSIPHWGWNTYYRTLTSSASNTVSTYSSSPPGGSYSPPAGWSVVSTTHTGSSQNRGSYIVVGSASFEDASEAGSYPIGRDDRFCSWNSDNTLYSCTYVRYQWVHSYSYSLEKIEPYQLWELQYHYDSGCNSTEQTDPTRMKDNFTSHSYRSNAEVVYVRMDNQPWTWAYNSSEVNTIVNKMRQTHPFFWHFNYEANRSNFHRLMTQAGALGKFSIYDVFYKARNVQEVKDYLIEKYMVENDGENYTILLGEKVDYTVTYEDFENDPELAREWKFSHDKTKVNGREIDNQMSTISESDYWLNNPIQLYSVGTYKIQVRSKDNPVHFGDSRFNNYQKWSDEELVRDYYISVHRRPIADFTFAIDTTDNYKLTLNPTPSYDPEHQFNREDKGIVEYEWTSYLVDGVKHDGPPPTNLEPNRIYDITLQVKDIDGAYGTVTKRISTMGINEKPVALFDVSDTVFRSQPLNILDKSYDPNGDELTNYIFTVRKQGSDIILKTLNDFPNSFAEIGLEAGNYVLGLTVDDIPRIPPSLRSDLYERNIKVINDNNPPTSVFTLQPNPIQLGLDEKATYTDSSYDIDGHELINYSWKIEKVNEDGAVLRTWETGVAPTDFSEYGVGKYRVYQTVFDNPPAPLQSLSDTSMVEIEVIIGKQRPYAVIDYSPEMPIEGDRIILDPSKSFDFDGTIVKWEWQITSPTGQVTNSTSEKPVITNAIKGDYRVHLHVYDNDNLRSMVPAVEIITVKERPPNEIPVAFFNFNPLTPIYNQEVSFNPDDSYDLDGEIVGWEWIFTDTRGNVTRSTEEYPNITARSYVYTVSLVVEDNKGAKSLPFTRTVHVSPELIPLVYHTPEWEQIRIENDRPANMFYAGEKFLIRVETSPALSVEGKVNFGGSIGEIEIPKSSFQKVNAEGTVWESALWHESFQYIPQGEYVFEFKSEHDGGQGSILNAEGIYKIIIDDNIYSPLNFHRNY